MSEGQMFTEGNYKKESHEISSEDENKSVCLLGRADSCLLKLHNVTPGKAGALWQSHPEAVTYSEPKMILYPEQEAGWQSSHFQCLSSHGTLTALIFDSRDVTSSSHEALLRSVALLLGSRSVVMHCLSLFQCQRGTQFITTGRGPRNNIRIQEVIQPFSTVALKTVALLWTFSSALRRTSGKWLLQRKIVTISAWEGFCGERGSPFRHSQPGSATPREGDMAHTLHLAATCSGAWLSSCSVLGCRMQGRASSVIAGQTGVGGSFPVLHGKSRGHGHREWWCWGLASSLASIPSAVS